MLPDDLDRDDPDDGIAELQRELNRSDADLIAEMQAMREQRQRSPEEILMNQDHEMEFDQGNKRGVETDDTPEQGQAKRQRTETVEAADQGAGPAADASSERKILIPVDNDGKPMAEIKKGTKEVNLEQFDPGNEDHKKHVADKNAPVLIENEKTGSMLTPQATFQVTNGKWDKDTKVRAENKAEAYADTMKELGLNPERPDKSSRQNYKNMPGLLVEDQDGSNKAIDPKQVDDLEKLKAESAKVEIKTPRGSYQDLETYDRTHLPNKGVDARLEQMQNAPEKREDMADVYVRQGDGGYKSIDKQREENPDFKVDKKTELLIQTDSGTLVKPSSYKDREGLKDVLEKNDIDPKDVGSPVRKNGADVLVKTDKDTLEVAANMNKEDLKDINREDVFVQNQNRKQSPTGSYMDADRAEKYGKGKDVPGRIEAAGIELPAKEAASAEAKTNEGPSRAQEIATNEAAKLAANQNERAPEAMNVESSQDSVKLNVNLETRDRGAESHAR